MVALSAKLVALSAKLVQVGSTGADPAFGQGGGCKNNGTPTFAAAIAKVSDHVHAPETSYRSQHE